MRSTRNARADVRQLPEVFFICLNDQPSLDFGGLRFDDGQGAAAFGRVVRGLEVAREIQKQPVEAQRLTPPVPIVKAARVAG